MRRPFLVLSLAMLSMAPPTAMPLEAQSPAARPDRIDRTVRLSTAPVGTFVAAQIDREALPVKDQVVDEDGTLYLIEFDRMVLTLRADWTFRAAVRYRRTLFANDARGRARATPLQNMNVTGTFVMVGNEIRFTPDESRETRGLRMLAGTVTGTRELSVPFHYRNGTAERNRTLVMQRNDNVL